MKFDKQNNLTMARPKKETAPKAETFPAIEEKVKEVKTEPTGEVKPQQTQRKPERINRNLHTVIVKGKERQMSRLAYEAIAKDPSLDVRLPKGSTLVEPNLQPCKDC